MKNSPLLSITLATAVLLLVGCNSVPVTGERADTAVQWQRWEAVLTAQQEHAQPYATVNVDVHFTGPAGATFDVPAFLDGGGDFRIRAAFPAAGVWRWRTTCSDPSDAGLNGRSGEVRVAAYAGDNPLYRHGDLRVSANRRHLIHADGTPFLWQGDTAWNALWRSTPAEWREYVDTRAGQRFSVVQTVATGTVAPDSPASPPAGQSPFLSDGTPNAAYWRGLEEKVAYANDRGMIVMLVGVGDSRTGFAASQRAPAFSRYLAGRLAGHLVIFSPSMDQRFGEENDAAGRRLQPLTTHLVTQHPGTHRETIVRYHDADYTDFCGVQSGHRGGNLELAYGGAREWTLEMWRRAPIKPVIHVEAMYDAHGHDFAPAWRERDVRKLGWIGWLSGARGYTYGAGDIPPKVPDGRGGIWRFETDPKAYDYWRKAIKWPSATQMTHLRDFWAGVDWWRLEPAPDLVKNQAAEQVGKMVAARSPEGDLLVAYLPDNPAIELDLTSMPAGLAGSWFNPVSGESIPLEKPPGSGSNVILRRPDGWDDAALLLTKPKNKPQGTAAGD